MNFHTFIRIVGLLLALNEFSIKIPHHSTTKLLLLWQEDPKREKVFTCGVQACTHLQLKSPPRGSTASVFLCFFAISYIHFTSFLGRYDVDKSVYRTGSSLQEMSVTQETLRNYTPGTLRTGSTRPVCTASRVRSRPARSQTAIHLT